MRIALAVAQSEFTRLESSAACITNAQAEELASLRNQSTEEISLARQKLAFNQHAMNSERQIHIMQHEVIAHKSVRESQSSRAKWKLQPDKLTMSRKTRLRSSAIRCKNSWHDWMKSLGIVLG